jgi:tetratricopeptide (TPR) repeat protein
VLGTGGAIETAMRTASGPDTISDVERRRLLQLTGILGAAAVVGVDGASIERSTYGAEHAALWRDYLKADRKQDRLAPTVARLEELLAAGGDPAACADVLQMAGEILFDGNRFVDAANVYTAAGHAAREAHAADLWACSLVRHGWLALAEERYEDAAGMLSAAGRVASRSGDSQRPARAWAAQVEAHALAGLGDVDGCLRALDIAETVRDMPSRPFEGWLRFDGGRLAEERGACLVRLGRPQQAEPVLLQALATLTPGRRQGAVLADLVQVGRQLRDTERVKTYEAKARKIARDTRSGWVAAKLKTETTKGKA